MNSSISIPDKINQFAIKIIKLCDRLDSNPGVSHILVKQLIKSNSSIGVNIYATNHCSSTSEAINCLKASLKGVDETKHWLGTLIASGEIDQKEIKKLLEEVDELGEIFYNCAKTLEKLEKKR